MSQHRRREPVAVSIAVRWLGGRFYGERVLTWSRHVSQKTHPRTPPTALDRRRCDVPPCVLDVVGPGGRGPGNLRSRRLGSATFRVVRAVHADGLLTPRPLPPHRGRQLPWRGGAWPRSRWRPRRRSSEPFARDQVADRCTNVTDTPAFADHSAKTPGLTRGAHPSGSSASPPGRPPWRRRRWRASSDTDGRFRPSSPLARIVGALRVGRPPCTLSPGSG